jgi:ABC-type multidrug transport system fused ATPase/permease subunit
VTEKGFSLFSEIKIYWTDGTLRHIFQLLNKKDRKFVRLLVTFQFFASILDLAGIAFIGVLGSLTVAGIQSKSPSNLIQDILEYLQLSEFTFQYQVGILGAMAAVSLLSRSFITIFLSRATLRFLSQKSAEASTKTIKKLFSSPLTKIQERSSQDYLFAVTSGISGLFMGVISTAINVVSDLAVLFVLTLGLFLVNPLMAAGTFIFFAALGIIMFGRLQRKAENLGREFANLSVEINQSVIQVLNSYREYLVRGRSSYYIKNLEKVRFRLADTEAAITFMPNIMKYAMEMALVFGAILIAAGQFIMSDASRAVATLTVFLAAGMRMAPALLRIQQSGLQIRNSLGSSHRTINLLASLSEVEELEEVESEFNDLYIGFVPNLLVSNVSFRYPNAIRDAVSDVSIEIMPGTVAAVVGSSGAGKSTLVDILLGNLSPQSGSVEVSGMSPSEVISKWPGAIAYVPQDTLIFEGTIRENISIGYPLFEATDERINSSLKTAQLFDFVQTLPEGIDTFVGDRGSQLSGGQRQRLGIARALFTKPKLLVLDEATSALDGQTEHEFTMALEAIKATTTVILIAHRLSSIKHSDKLIYLEDGEVIAEGTFDSVRTAVPNFDIQANLMGL